MSDIFDGDAFLPVLFPPAVIISGKAVLPDAKASDIYLADLDVLLTCAYAAGLIFRPKLQNLRMDEDSFAVLVLHVVELVFYVVGIGGLFAIAKSSVS